MYSPQLNDKELNHLLDQGHNEFLFVMLTSLISLLLDKGVISEAEFEKATSEIGNVFKLLKQRDKLQKNSENPVQNEQS